MIDEKRPENYQLINESISNFDHTVDEGMEEKLKNGQFYGEYAAWNFHGDVWWTGEQFACEIWIYGNHENTIYADTLEEIMKEASDLYGYK